VLHDDDCTEGHERCAKGPETWLLHPGDGQLAERLRNLLGQLEAGKGDEP
jgi:hypothetical protein